MFAALATQSAAALASLASSAEMSPSSTPKPGAFQVQSTSGTGDLVSFLQAQGFSLQEATVFVDILSETKDDALHPCAGLGIELRRRVPGFSFAGKVITKQGKLMSELASRGFVEVVLYPSPQPPDYKVLHL